MRKRDTAGARRGVLRHLTCGSARARNTRQREGCVSFPVEMVNQELQFAKADVEVSAKRPRTIAELPANFPAPPLVWDDPAGSPALPLRLAGLDNAAIMFPVTSSCCFGISLLLFHLRLIEAGL